MKKLKVLDLSSNPLTFIPPEIGKLRLLESLFLGKYTGFDFHPLENLRHKRIGFMNGRYLSKLKRIPIELNSLSNLKRLDLSGMEISQIPLEINRLTGLVSLSLADNKITSVEEWIKTLSSLETLDLRGNPLPIPPEILGLKEWHLAASTPAEEVLSFYFSLKSEEGTIPLYEAKLIRVGEGGAGKTSLAKKIDDEAYELPKDEKSTEGIDVIRWDFLLSDGNTFRVNIWDFGGQEIYHATHQFFLTKRSLYFLVADTRQENTDFYYWLKIVELLSDSSPVLVIKNEKQNRQCEIDEGLFKSQFDNLKDYLSTNLKENRGLNDIKDAIRYHISKLPHVGQPLPKIWVRVRAALENYAQNCNTITVDQYFDICRQNGFTDKQQMLSLSSYLHDLGVCLHFQDDKILKRTVILSPEWATAAVYKVADSDIVRNSKGRFTEQDTENIWSDSQYSELRDELLQLMMRFKLAYEIPHNPGQYIDPQLLPISKPDFAWKTRTISLFATATTSCQKAFSRASL